LGFRKKGYYQQRKARGGGKDEYSLQASTPKSVKITLKGKRIQENRLVEGVE